MKKKNTSHFKKYSQFFKDEMKRHKVLKRNIPNITLNKIVYEYYPRSFYVHPTKLSQRLLIEKNIFFKEIYSISSSNSGCNTKLESIIFFCHIQGQYVEVCTDYDKLYVDIGEQCDIYGDGYVNYSTDRRFALFSSGGMANTYTELNEFLDNNITEELKFQYSLVIDKLDFYVELYDLIKDLEKLIHKKYVTISELCNVPALRKIREEN